MTLKEEAEVLLEGILKEIKFIDSYNYRSHNTMSFVAKQCALLAVDFAEKIMTEYGSETNELQNMDRFFHDLEQLKKEIEQSWQNTKKYTLQ